MRTPLRFVLCLLAACVVEPGRAQFSPFEHQNTAPESISPLASLLESLNNRIYAGYDSYVADQRWDSARAHYVGNLPRYFHHPEIAAAGYTHFTVGKSDDRGADLSGGEQFSEELQRTAQSIERENTHDKLSYHFDTSGWLRAIRAENLYPEYQGYGEVDDSFFYTPAPGGGVSQLRWVHTSHRSSSGYAASIYCPPMPPFHHIYDTAIITIFFDAFENPVRLSSYNAARWDTCNHGGPKWGLREFFYDAVGRLTRITDSWTEYGGRWREVDISYEEMPFQKFARSVPSNPTLAPLAHPTVKSWLAERGPLTYLASRRVTKGFVYNIPVVGGPSRYQLRPDSPTVQLDSAFFLLDASRQRVVVWAEQWGRSAGRDAFAFYTRTGGRGGVPAQTSIQYISPHGASQAASRGDSLVLVSAALRTTDTVTTPAGRLVRYGTSDDVGGGYHNRSSPQRLLFGSRLGNPSAVRPKAAILIGPRGVARYVWTPYNVYQLSYR